ncbi:bifunctional nicotinamide-nucleotide adenylyltransferase/Nudix hydroxylase [Comamonas odontotermitis]|uniref:bifunctional nicotinamide-nucleotide adenylyltransferase/Nudix hydroxylase n=1 Tax=Comamonas odontotermitis TaxID=379895 RepID=UPI003750DCEE
MSPTTDTYDLAVLIGRFQPPHLGHLALLQQALARASRVIVVLGSAIQARSPKNPFTWQERAQMFAGALSPADALRVEFVPIRDYYDEPRWVTAVREAVTSHSQPGARIGLVGHFKDASSSYLAHFPGWELVSLPRQNSIDATPIRDAYFDAPAAGPAGDLSPLKEMLPASSLEFLQRFNQTPAYAELCTEWQMLRKYRQSWLAAPYPPVFVTVDALVRCGNEVLVIRRGHAPGKGLLALPGGFLEPRDTLWQSCLRELQEETHCALEEPSLRAALQSVTVFDHPDRSQRGRTITHVHYFDLKQSPKPAVRADDDAAEAFWLSIDAIRAREAEFFEDHFQILQKLLVPSFTAY